MGEYNQCVLPHERLGVLQSERGGGEDEAIMIKMSLLLSRLLS